MSFTRFTVGAFTVLLAAGCAGKPVTTHVTDPRALLTEACRPGQQIQKMKGSVFMKAKSAEASGQFPALVSADGPEHLRVEITNLLGGTEAVITVEGKKYHLEVPHHPDKAQEGAYTWGGIPLEWANALFLGRVPCPAAEQLGDAKLAVNAEGDLIVETAPTLGRESERFVYSFRDWSGSPWPQALHWERKGAIGPLAVDFKFDDPEDHTRSPRRWEAKSAQGDVKVRWKDRDTRS